MTTFKGSYLSQKNTINGVEFKIAPGANYTVTNAATSTTITVDYGVFYQVTKPTGSTYIFGHVNVGCTNTTGDYSAPNKIDLIRWNTSETFTKGGTKTFTATRTHSAYTFTFWLNQAKPTDSNSGAFYPIVYGVDVTVPAKASYAITYNANGGSGAPGGQTKWYGEDINLQPGTPTRSGYSFKNWNTKQDGTGTSYNPSQKYTANAGLTLYAQWNPNPYTVTYNANGGSGAPGPQTKYHGIALVLTTDVPVRSGYAFKSWNTKQDGAGTNFNAGGTYTVNSAVTLYAQWEAFNLIKIYDMNGNVQLGKLMVYDENGVLKECSIAVYDADGNRKYAKV